jgi:hypothetical protein
MLKWCAAECPINGAKGRTKPYSTDKAAKNTGAGTSCVKVGAW